MTRHENRSRDPGQQSKTQAGNKTRAAVLKATVFFSSVFLSDLPPGGALGLNNDQPSTIAV
jgi:hypothetical protein